jgi:hypothetical protein
MISFISLDYTRAEVNTNTRRLEGSCSKLLRTRGNEVLVLRLALLYGEKMPIEKNKM